MAPPHKPYIRFAPNGQTHCTLDSDRDKTLCGRDARFAPLRWTNGYLSCKQCRRKWQEMGLTRITAADAGRSVTKDERARPVEQGEATTSNTELRAHWNRIQVSTSGQPYEDALNDMARWHEREARACRSMARSLATA